MGNKSKVFNKGGIPTRAVSKSGQMQPWYLERMASGGMSNANLPHSFRGPSYSPAPRRVFGAVIHASSKLGTLMGHGARARQAARIASVNRS